MPRITSREMKKTKYVSMVDFSDKVAEYDRIDEKIRFAAKYLLAYRNKEGQADYTFEEAVHLAKLEIAETAINRRKLFSEEQQQRFRDNPQTVDPNYAGDPQDINNEFFMGSTASYILGYGWELDRELTNEEIQERDTYETLFLGDFDKKLEDLDKRPNAIDVRYRLEKRLGSKKDVEDLYKATQPGFFSKMFNTSSREFNQLDTMWKAFNNPNHAMYGDLVGLKNASNQYLQHKFPNWRPGQPITPEMYQGLDKTEIARVNFCDKVNTAVDEQSKIGPACKELMEACANQKISFRDVNRLSPMQNIFQRQLEEQLALDELNDEVENDNEIQNEAPEVNNENEINHDDLDNE